MKLYYSSTSPYARKVRIVILENNLTDQVEHKLVNPWDDPEDLVAINPLGKIPTLELSTGDILFDSPVICEYIDSFNKQVPLFPSSGMDRWTALRQQALGDGVMDASVNLFLEQKRSPDMQNQGWMDRQKGVITRSLDLMAGGIAEMGEGLSIGGISYGVALSYLDLRHGVLNWREGREALANWHQETISRPSFQKTAPDEG